MPTKTRTYAVDMTLAEVIALRDLVRSEHGNEAYYARMRPDETTEDEDWKRNQIAKSRTRQETLSALHETLVGEPLEATPENDPAPVDSES